jgi:hypothetical protein
MTVRRPTAHNNRFSGRSAARPAAKPERWVGKTRSRSERGRSEVVVLVREVLRVTAAHPASCGGRLWPCADSLNKGCLRRHRCGILGLRRHGLFSRSCSGSGWFCDGAIDPTIKPTSRFQTSGLGSLRLIHRAVRQKPLIQLNNKVNIICTNSCA